MEEQCRGAVEERPRPPPGGDVAGDASAPCGGQRNEDADRQPKKRKTRRGKSKRRHPYNKNLKMQDKLIKPEAPHNSNEFLLEDHALVEQLDDNLRVTPSTLRTRDSSFSVDTDGGEFYSSPEDEEQFLIKDFCDQYESLHAERLQALSKAELIQEYLLLENKLDQLSKRLMQTSEDNRTELGKEVERLTAENERLRRENESLTNKARAPSDSEDSETDSSSSCSSSSSSSSGTSCDGGGCSDRSRSPVDVEYGHVNGHVRSPVEAAE